MANDVRLIREVYPFLSSEEGYDMLSSMGCGREVPLTVADSEERLVDVFHRMKVTGKDRMLLAVIFARRGKTVFFAMKKGKAEAPEENTFKTDSTSDSTIGMLVDDICNRRSKGRSVIRIREASRYFESVASHECVKEPIAA